MFETLAVLLVLQIKHWYADFYIQTYDQTVKKGIYLNPVGLSHSIDHIWTSLVALFIASFFTSITIWAILPVCIIEGMIHYHIDWVKVHYGSKDMCKPLFWNQFGLDQLAHQVTYLAMVVALF